MDTALATHPTPPRAPLLGLLLAASTILLAVLLAGQGSATDLPSATPATTPPNATQSAALAPPATGPPSGIGSPGAVPPRLAGSPPDDALRDVAGGPPGIAPPPNASPPGADPPLGIVPGPGIDPPLGARSPLGTGPSGYASPPVGAASPPGAIPPPGVGPSVYAGPPVAAFGWPLAPPHPVLRPFQPPSTPYGPGHRGVDLGGTLGEPVLAAGDGLVLYAGPLADRSLVSVEHTGGLRTTYEPVRPVVHVGDHVRRGQVIGVLLGGHPGCPATAPTVCLHWGAHRQADYLDPLRLVDTGHVRLLPWLP